MDRRASRWRLPWLTLALLVAAGATAATHLALRRVAPLWLIRHAPIAIACDAAARRRDPAEVSALADRIGACGGRGLAAAAAWWRRAPVDARRGVAPAIVRSVYDPTCDVVGIAPDTERLALLALVAADEDRAISDQAMDGLDQVLYAFSDHVCPVDAIDGDLPLVLDALRPEEVLRFTRRLAGIARGSPDDRFGQPGARACLRRALATTPTTRAERAEILSALYGCGDAAMAERLRCDRRDGAIGDSDLDEWLLLAWDPAAAAAIAALLSDDEPGITCAAACALARLRATDQVPALIAAAGRCEPAVRQAALLALAELRDPRSLPLFARALDGDDRAGRLLAVTAASGMAGAEAAALLARAARDEDPMIADAARAASIAHRACPPTAHRRRRSCWCARLSMLAASPSAAIPDSRTAIGRIVIVRKSFHVLTEPADASALRCAALSRKPPQDRPDSPSSRSRSRC